MRRRAFVFPKVMKAAAGPHDLGSGDRYDETFQELLAQMVPYNEDSTTDDLDSVTGHDSDLELYHHDSSEERDIFDEIAEYAFRNPEAEAVLFHYNDITRMREGVPLEAEMSEIVLKRKLYIYVDNDGVGRLVHRKQQKLSPGTYIPRRLIQDGCIDEMILFEMPGCKGIPAEAALAGRCELLVGAPDDVFTEPVHSICLQIEWPGYDEWSAQVRIVYLQEKPRWISRAELAGEIAKQLENFIKQMGHLPINPDYELYKVGAGGIELRHIHIAALEQVFPNLWQPHLVYVG